MKKTIFLSLLFFLTALVSIAQTIVQPPPSVPENAGSSFWVKVALAIGAVAIMGLIFYLMRNFNKKKSS